jgi:nitroimidazol reductase NimA-like FMN-containing flavoprotein (pyridoxamine 5'-phosphate oxidase superfamily)
MATASTYGSYDDQARSILDHNRYMVLATSTKAGRPWAAPVFFTFDKDYNFYFLSAIDSRHAKDIAENPFVSVVIYDSNSPIGISQSVQIEGKASFVQEKELGRVISLYSSRLFKSSHLEPTERYRPEDYGEGAEFRFFKITVSSAFTTGADRRVNISLKKSE